MLSFTWDMNKVEKAKQKIRDVWEYRPVNKIPINFTVYSNPKKYTLHEQIKDVDKELDVALNTIKRTLELTSLDYIPVMGPEVGNVLIENAFGLKAKFPENPEQTPFWVEPIIKDIDDIYNLKIPNSYEDEFFIDCLDRLRYLASKVEGKIYLGGYDTGGPLNVALNLMDVNLFYISLIENKEAMHDMLNKITLTFIVYYSLIVDAAGGINKMSNIYFHLWTPEGYKGAVADDVCANIPPEMFNEFSKPYNSRILRVYGPGAFHNCGPNPCVFEYIDHDPPIKAINLFYDYSKNDLEKLAEAFAHRAVLYMSWWNSDPPEKVFKEYKNVCDKFAPQSIIIPQYGLDDSQYSDSEILEVYNELNKISIEYTKSMIWKKKKNKYFPEGEHGV